MRRNIITLLLFVCALLSCGTDDYYTHSIEWTCLASSCERTEALSSFDRAWFGQRQINLHSEQDPSVIFITTRVTSDSLPDGCVYLYGLELFGHVLEPLILCRAGAGFDTEVSIPNVNPSTSSDWRIEFQPL